MHKEKYRKKEGGEVISEQDGCAGVEVPKEARAGFAVPACS